MQFDLNEQVTVFEARARTGKPEPGGKRLTGTVEDIEPFTGEGTKVSVDVPGFEEFMTFDAETGQAWGGNYDWRLLPADTDNEAATAAGQEG